MGIGYAAGYHSRGTNLPTGDFSFFTWLRFTVTPTGFTAIMSLDNNANFFEYYGDNASRACRWFDNGVDTIIVTPNVGEWIALAVVRKGSGAGGLRNYYWRASTGFVKTTASAAAFATINKYFIGSAGDAAGPSENGKPDQDYTRLWNVALTDAEIARQVFLVDDVRPDALLCALDMGRGIVLPLTDHARHGGGMTITGTLVNASQPSRPPLVTQRLNNFFAGKTYFFLQHAYTIPLSETWATYSAALAAHMGAHISPAETVASSESLAAHMGAHLALAESASLSESLVTKYNAKVAPAETVALSEALAAKMGAHLALSETVASSESLAAKYNAKVTDAETVALSEVLTHPSGSQYTAAISETWTTYSESLAAHLGAHPAIAESVALSEAIAAKQAMKNPLAESVSLTESIAAKFGAHLALAETVASSESLAASKGAHPAIAESVALSEALAAKYNAKVHPADTVPLFEVLTHPASTGGGGFRMFLVL